MNKECDILLDVMSFVGEICILKKFSPKQEHFLGNINDNIRKEDFETFQKLKKAFGDEMEILYRMSENESLIIMNPS